MSEEELISKQGEDEKEEESGSEVMPELPVGTSTPFGNYSWEQISEIAKSGMASTYFRVGEIKELALTTGEVMRMAILGFDMDTASDGSAIPITLQAVDCMNKRCNAKNFAKYMNEVYASIPTNVKKIIIPACKGQEYETLWLPNEIEVFGKTAYSKDNFGNQYPYYQEKCHRCKFRNNSPSTVYWWLRSVASVYDGGHCRVSRTGYHGSFGDGFALNMAPAFCIG